MDKQTRQLSMIFLAAALITLCVYMIVGVGCSLKRDRVTPEPAQQQIKNTLSVAHDLPILVEHVDVDQDGTITAQERQSLIADQPGVLLTFGTIMGMVLFASVASAWASNRWAPKPHPKPDPQSTQASELLTEHTANDGERRQEPAAPEEKP